MADDFIFVKGLEAKCKIGIFDWERKIKQRIRVDLEMPADIRKASRRDRIEDTLDYKSISKHTLSFIEKSEFFLVETLVEKLAESLLRKFPIKKIRVRLEKPGAIRHAETVGIQITRTRR